MSLVRGPKPDGVGRATRVHGVVTANQVRALEVEHEKTGCCSPVALRRPRKCFTSRAVYCSLLVRLLCCSLSMTACNEPTRPQDCPSPSSGLSRTSYWCRSPRLGSFLVFESTAPRLRSKHAMHWLKIKNSVHNSTDHELARFSCAVQTGNRFCAVCILPTTNTTRPCIFFLASLVSGCQSVSIPGFSPICRLPRRETDGIERSPKITGSC